MWEQLAEDTAKAVAVPLSCLRDEELIAGLRTAHQVENNAAALTARFLAEITSRHIPAEQGHRSIPAWLGEQLLIDPCPARELAAQAAALRANPHLEQALIDGHLDVRQTTAIAETIQQIPATLHNTDPDPTDPDRPTITAAAEATLIQWAARLPAGQLRRAGERILAHVAPEIADRAEEAALRRQERRAHHTRFFTLSRPVNGIIRLTGSLDIESAAIIEAALQPLCRPTPGDDRTPGQQRADALTDICRLTLHTSELPTHGGEPAQVAVTVAFNPLTKALRAGHLDNGERVSASTARRVACDAKILPLILGSDSQILDAGRTRRLATGPLRRALTIRDQGCTFPDCDRPPRWTDAHHLVSWIDGGPTSLDNMILLCRRHHRLLHDPDHGWHARLGADGLPEFIPPPWIDPTRQPRRNLYHMRT